MAKPSWEKNLNAGSMSSTATGQPSSLWVSLRKVTSATDAQKLKHIRIAYSFAHSADRAQGVIELMRWPEALTPTTSEPAAQDTQIFVQRPIVTHNDARHYGFLRWPGVVIKPGENIFLGLRIIAAGTGTSTLNFVATWLETVV